MNNFVKLILIIIVLAFLIGSVVKWFNIYIRGHYFENASIFTSVIVGLIPIILGYISFLAIKSIIKYK